MPPGGYVDVFGIPTDVDAKLVLAGVGGGGVGGVVPLGGFVDTLDAPTEVDAKYEVFGVNHDVHNV